MDSTGGGPPQKKQKSEGLAPITIYAVEEVTRRHYPNDGGVYGYCPIMNSTADFKVIPNLLMHEKLIGKIEVDTTYIIMRYGVLTDWSLKLPHGAIVMQTKAANVDTRTKPIRGFRLEFTRNSGRFRLNDAIFRQS